MHRDDEVETSGESPWGTLERLASGDLTIPDTGKIVERFRELQARLARLESLRGQALVDSVFPKNHEWADSIRSLASLIEGDAFDAKELHESLRTRITQPELPTDVDYVRVMSLHKSKGLTADVVAVVGCIEGLVPTLPQDTLNQADLLDEQRRLFYVAVTRTRQTLILSSVTQLPSKLAYKMGAQVRRNNRGNAPTIASRFLHELGPELPAAVRGTAFLKRAAR